MAKLLKAALSRSYNIDLPIVYLLGETFIFERLQISQRRSLLQAINCLLRDWPNNFIQFCQANNLACDFLLGDRLHDLPFWYLRVVREHLNRGAHKVSDGEIISIVDYVRHGGDQPTTEELRPFISSEVVKRARRAGLIKRRNIPGFVLTATPPAGSSKAVSQPTGLNSFVVANVAAFTNWTIRRAEPDQGSLHLLLKAFSTTVEWRRSES